VKFPIFIDTQEQLKSLVEYLFTFDAIAVDTEFVWQRTYFPQLGIIQLAVSPEDAYIVDTVAITDPTPLRKLMGNRDIVKIFHDAHQDIVIINQYIGGTVSNVFDTQRAAGFTGRERSLSLDKLIKEFTGIQLDKSETRTNWLKRPLDPKQIEYALDDVRYLPQVRLQLIELATEKGNELFVADEMLCFENIIPFDIEDALEKQFKKVAGRLPKRYRDSAFRLTQWREDVARHRDSPREHVIKKESINAIASSGISTIEELAESNLVSSKFVGRYGKSLIEALNGTESATKKMLKMVSRNASDSGEMVILISLFQTFVHSLAEDRGIDSTLIYNKAGIASLVRKFCKERSFPTISGWRGELLTEAGTKFLTGKGHITFTLPELEETE